MSKVDGFNSITREFLYKDNYSDNVIALVGNSKVEKNRIFKTIVGMNQYKIKKLNIIYGKYNYNDEDYILVNLPSKYNYINEIIVRDFIAFYNPILIIFVIDSVNIKRDIILIFEIMELTNNIILCINNSIVNAIDIEMLKYTLEIPIIEINNKNSICNLKREIYKNSYESNIKLNTLSYSKETEISISNIENYLNTLFSFNNRWLSIKLLTDDTIKSSINKYLNYDIDCDIYLTKMINNEKENNSNIKKDIIKVYLVESSNLYINCVI